MYNTYDLGDLVRLEIEISISGAYVDPTHLSLFVTDPDQVEHHFIYGTTGAFVKESVGKYNFDYYAAQSGQYKYRFYASGTAWGAEVARFVVRRE